MCYSCVQNALQDVVPAAVAELGCAKASPETAELFERAVFAVTAASEWDASEHPMPAAARILVRQMLAWCTREPDVFASPPPARMVQFLLNVCVRMSTVEVTNPRNARTPGIDTISRCLKELLQQLRQTGVPQGVTGIPAEPHLSEDIIAAAAKGNLTAVRQLVGAKRGCRKCCDGATAPKDSGSKIDFHFLRSEGQDFNEMVVEPLTAAAMGGHDDVVGYLLQLDQRGLVVADSGGMGERVLAAAAAAGSLAVARLLHASGFTKDAGVYEDPAIVQAARAGHTEMVALLLDLGVSSVDQKRSEQSYIRTYGSLVARPTPLWVASDAGQQDVVRLLVARKAKLDSCTNEQTSLGRAVAMGHHGTADILRAAGAPEGPLGGSAEAIKSAKQLDLGKFAVLDLKLARPSPIVEGSRLKGSLTL